MKFVISSLNGDIFLGSLQHSLILSLHLLFLEHILFIRWTLVIPNHTKDYPILILLHFSYIFSSCPYFCRLSHPEVVNNPTIILPQMFRSLSLREPTTLLSEILSVCFHSPFELLFIHDLKPSAEDSQHSTSALCHTYLLSLQQKQRQQMFTGVFSRLMSPVGHMPRISENWHFESS